MIVVADTSPLSNLVAIGQLEVLHAIYQEVVIPEAVAAEIRVGERRGAHVAFLEREAWITVRPVSDRSIVDELAGRLDLGEAEAIALSLEIDAELLLIDERAGREAAVERGIRTVGLLGTLAVAKSRRLVPRVKPLLDDLRDKAGFWISQTLYESVLRQCGERD